MDWRYLLKTLVLQIDINDFTDSHGHQAKQLKAFNEAKHALDCEYADQLEKELYGESEA